MLFLSSAKGLVAFNECIWDLTMVCVKEEKHSYGYLIICAGELKLLLYAVKHKNEKLYHDFYTYYNLAM